MLVFLAYSVFSRYTWKVVFMYIDSFYFITAINIKRVADEHIPLFAPNKGRIEVFSAGSK